ncbi:hypothetical protein, conserved [Plasmodium gonderi]|uniref:Uncharacterized protein n=1 Tax=Plasmodium gonderi TaxID=77519 RepID=A0A1Y1JMS7_PLAGO|nr:hypothetical protein, conserved [Plasmodium gonderi]GAW81344.1 hypothetical protein, conserved [Plasmodium gonderi]
MSKKRQKKKKSKGKKKENNSSFNAYDQNDDLLNEGEPNRRIGYNTNGHNDNNSNTKNDQISEDEKKGEKNLNENVKTVYHTNQFVVNEKENKNNTETCNIKKERFENVTYVGRFINGLNSDSMNDKTNNMSDNISGKTDEENPRQKKNVPMVSITKKVRKEENKKLILNSDDINDLLMLSGEQCIEEKTSILFPHIDIDPKSYMFMEKEDSKNEFVNDISKEIDKIKNKFNGIYFASTANNHRNNFNTDYSNKNGRKSIRKNIKKNKEVQYIDISKKRISANNNKNNSYKNCNNYMNHNCNVYPKNIFFEKEKYIFYDVLIKGHMFLSLKRKIKKKKKKKKIKIRTKNYKIISDLCEMRKEEGTQLIKEKKDKKNRREKYYVFNYNCGNTKIQSITGYIRCFKDYYFYRENSSNAMVETGKNSSHLSSHPSSFNGSHSGSYNNYNLNKGLNKGKQMLCEVVISVLLCVNVSNCLSPSEFLELLYPLDNFIFFLKVLNKKSNEEYMIYFLTFNVYAKKIMKKMKTVTFFNMKRKKRLKVYIVKDITMNVTSRIKKNTQRMIIEENAFFEEKKKKVPHFCMQKEESELHITNEKIRKPWRRKFINALCLISQNKFQLSCAVCLEPLYSDYLSKIISHIFNFNFENQKKRSTTSIKYSPMPSKNSRNDMLIKDCSDSYAKINKIQNGVVKGSNAYSGNVNSSSRKRKCTDVGPLRKDSLPQEKTIAKNKEIVPLYDDIYYDKNKPNDKLCRKKDYSSSDNSSKGNGNISCKGECHYGGKTFNSNMKDSHCCLKTMDSYTSCDCNYHFSTVRFVNSMLKRHNNEVKKKRKKNRKPIFSNVCINILCNHIFHSNCLKKCCFTSCPICRYKQYNYQIANCDICEKNQNSKICLFCGFIGCSVNYDRLDKLKEQMIKEKKRLLRKKKHITIIIKYIFFRIINFFIKKDNYIIVSPFGAINSDQAWHYYYISMGEEKKRKTYFNDSLEVKKNEKKYMENDITQIDVNKYDKISKTQFVDSYSMEHVEGVSYEVGKVNEFSCFTTNTAQKNETDPILRTQNGRDKDINSLLYVSIENKMVDKMSDPCTKDFIYIQKRGIKENMSKMVKYCSLNFLHTFRKMIGIGNNKEKKMKEKKINQIKTQHKNFHKNKRSESRINDGCTKRSRNKASRPWAHGRKTKNSSNKVENKRRKRKRKAEGYSFNKYNLVRSDRYTCKHSFEKRGEEKKLIDHAKDHFCETMHNYFFDISKNSVFDYSSNVYIKKLINLKNEKKKFKKMYTGNIHMNEKEEIIEKKNIIMYIYEFNQLLSALLESQRDHFLSYIYELKLNYENIHKDNSSEASKCFSEIKILQEKNQHLKVEIKKKINIFHDKAKTNAELLQQLRNVEIINEKLCESQKKKMYDHEAKVEEKKKIIQEKQQIIRDLNQQITDLSFHKQAITKFSQNADVTNSSFMIGEKMTQKGRFKKR